MAYADLTTAEQAHWDEYTNLRALASWPGFDAAQDQRRADARAWLEQRREHIRALARGTVPGARAGWDAQRRRARFDQLHGDRLNAGAPAHEYRLPAPGSCTDAEKVYIEEREVWMVLESTTDEQRDRKQACSDTLVTKRQRLYRLMKEDPDGNAKNDRRDRYDALCIATRHGRAWATHSASRNKYGESFTEHEQGGRSRQVALAHQEARVGYTEQPAGSNFDGRPDGIRTAQRCTAGGGTWLDHTPWCGSWCYYAMDHAGVKGLTSSIASVAAIENAAKAGTGCFRGWTTDRSKVLRGDLVIVGGYGVHVEMVRGFKGSNTLTYGGNTSAGSYGSQSNGGGAFRRERTPTEVRGYALVDYP